MDPHEHSVLHDSPFNTTASLPSSYWLPSCLRCKVEGQSSQMVHEDDDIPDLRDMSLFYKLYLIVKMLGEAVSIKFIISKCMVD